jgi:hypothetical protein
MRNVEKFQKNSYQKLKSVSTPQKYNIHTHCGDYGERREI